jgi:hypothetical protein
MKSTLMQLFPGPGDHSSGPSVGRVLHPGDNPLIRFQTLAFLVDHPGDRFRHKVGHGLVARGRVGTKPAQEGLRKAKGYVLVGGALHRFQCSATVSSPGSRPASGTSLQETGPEGRLVRGIQSSPQPLGAPSVCWLPSMDSYAPSNQRTCPGEPVPTLARAFVRMAHGSAEPSLAFPLTDGSTLAQQVRYSQVPSRA